MAKKESIASMKYDSTNTTRVYIKLNTKNDADIIEYLSKQSNKQGYIKELIRKDMERQKED